MEKDDKIEINAGLLMACADKIIHDPRLGTASVITHLVEEIKVKEKIYELRIELRLKGLDEALDKVII